MIVFNFNSTHLGGAAMFFQMPSNSSTKYKMSLGKTIGREYNSPTRIRKGKKKKNMYIKEEKTRKEIRRERAASVCGRRQRKEEVYARRMASSIYPSRKNVCVQYMLCIVESQQDIYTRFYIYVFSELLLLLLLLP
jgi:hypothetical protein